MTIKDTIEKSRESFDKLDESYNNTREAKKERVFKWHTKQQTVLLEAVVAYIEKLEIPEEDVACDYGDHVDKNEIIKHLKEVINK